MDSNSNGNENSKSSNGTSDQRTGITGDCTSQTVPIHQRYCLPHAALRLDLAQRDLTEYLQKISSERADSFAATEEKEVVCDIRKIIICSCLGMKMNRK